MARPTGARRRGHAGAHTKSTRVTVLRMLGTKRLYGNDGPKQKRCLCDRCGGFDKGWRRCLHPAVFGDTQGLCFSCVRGCTPLCTAAWCEVERACNTQVCVCACVAIRESLSTKGTKRKANIRGENYPCKYR